MRSTFRLIVCITVTFCLFSCSKEYTPKDQNPQPVQSEIVPIDIARQVAEGWAKKKFVKNNSQTAAPRIAEEKTVSELNVPYFYIFNMANKGGFVIVSAEKYEHPILAFSDEGEFQSENAPYGIISWLETTKQNIRYIRSGGIDTKRETTAEWNELSKDYGIPSMLRPPPDPSCQDYSVSTTVGPLLATTWGQGCGYNDAVPVDPTGASCGHYPTGCVATAMAQIMRYWQWPNSYNWGLMPNNFAVWETADLMRDVGLSVGMDYATAGSGAPHEAIDDALRNSFGYATAQDAGYGLSSYDHVRQQLSSNRPVLLCGYNDKNTSWFGLVVEYSTGHEWVCDGYIDTDIYWCNPDGSQGGAGYLSFHMNWGWNGTSNGWYAFNSWAPTGQGLNFQYARKMITNIHP